MASLLPSAGLGVPKAGSRGGGVCVWGGGGLNHSPLSRGSVDGSSVGLSTACAPQAQLGKGRR